jgi:hypothetical protein
MRARHPNRTIALEEHPVRAVLAGLLALLLLAALAGAVAASLTLGTLRLAELLVD